MDSDGGISDDSLIMDAGSLLCREMWREGLLEVTVGQEFRRLICGEDDTWASKKVCSSIHSPTVAIAQRTEAHHHYE